MDNIDIQVDQTPGGMVARIIGSAGVDQIDELDRQLHLLTALSPKLVVLDMSAVPYVSSMGIGSLLRFRHQVTTAGGRVALAALQKVVADTFKLSKIDKVLPMYDSVDAAMKA